MSRRQIRRDTPRTDAARGVCSARWTQRTDDDSLPDGLLAAARSACRQGPPWSEGHPPRAAALSAISGAIYTGRDTKSPAGDGAVVPAEQIALYKAVMAGERSLQCLVVCAGARGTADGGPPDGTTLQILHEFSPGLRVYWGYAGRIRGGAEVRDLLPGAFTGEDLDRAGRFIRRGKP